jgi:hypothetical protein
LTEDACAAKNEPIASPAEAAMTRITRREFLQYGLVGAAFALPWPAQAAKGGSLAKYVQPLPVPGSGIVIATPSGPNAYSFTQRQISRELHPELPATPFWAYDDGSGLGGQAGSFGMAVVAQSGTPLAVSYTHALPATYPSWIPVDTRLTPLGTCTAASWRPTAMAIRQ